MSICIPLEACRKDVAFDLDLMAQAAYQVNALVSVRNNAGDGLTMFSNDQALRSK